MRVNLKCPYDEKDKVKHLGARWDAVRRTWYVAGVEDLTPFKQWIPDFDRVTRVSRSSDQDGCVTLTKEIIHRHATKNGGWTRVQLAAIGVDWPPPQGWIDRAIGRKIDADAFRVFSAAAGQSSHTKKNTEPPIVTIAPAIAWCGCTHVLPWEDCEHTSATQH